MADLSDEIQELRLQNSKFTAELSAQGEVAGATLTAQLDTALAVDQLTETFKQFFKAERRDKEGDDLEASREAPGQVSKEGAMGAATGRDIDKLDFWELLVVMYNDIIVVENSMEFFLKKIKNRIIVGYGDLYL